MSLTAQPWESSPRIQLSSRATGFPQTSEGREPLRWTGGRPTWTQAFGEQVVVGPQPQRRADRVQTPALPLLGCVTVGKSFHPRGPVTPPMKRGSECPPQRAVGRSKRNKVPNALTERASVVARSSHKFPAVPVRRVRTRDKGSPVSVSRPPGLTGLRVTLIPRNPETAATSADRGRSRKQIFKYSEAGEWLGLTCWRFIFSDVLFLSVKVVSWTCRLCLV